MSDTASPLPVTTDVWARFRTSLLRFLQSRLPSDDDAKDVLQEVFARIHEGLGRIEQPERLQSWVFSIARRAVADFYRERGRRPDTASVADPEEAGVEPAAWPEATNLTVYRGEHDVHEEVLTWLVPMIAELPEGYAEAVRLADVEGLTQQELAERLGLSLSGAKSRVQRGRVLLGEVLRACCEVEFGPDGRAMEYRPRTRRCEDGC